MKIIKNNIAENLKLINSKFETNKNNISENLTLINSKFETNKNNISENLTLLNSNESRLDNIIKILNNLNLEIASIT